MDTAQQARISRGREQKFYLLDVTEGEGECYAFKISGSTGNVYTVRILKATMDGGCDCPDNKLRPALFCKHMCFLFVKVFRQRAESIPAPFPIGEEGVGCYRGDVDQKYGSQYRRRVERNGQRGGICAICFDELPEGVRFTVSCGQCQNSVHRACWDEWVRFGRKASCVYCRSCDVGEGEGEGGGGGYLKISLS